MIKKEIDIFLTAVMFYTRIPCPSNIDHSDDFLNRSTRYFPLIGTIVGGFVALVYWAFSFILTDSIAIVLSMVSGIFLTGAFHEDGFADVCDGFGGGYTREMRLNIMKDSRNGTYGTVGLILILGLKFLLLKELALYSLPFILIIAHSFSRFVPTLIIYTGEYARDDLTSKVKPIGKSISFTELLLALFFALAPFILLKDPRYLVVTILPVIMGLFLQQYFKKRIGGYTGDCLGTIQQVSEITLYLGILIVNTKWL